MNFVGTPPPEETDSEPGRALVPFMSLDATLSAFLAWTSPVREGFPPWPHG